MEESTDTLLLRLACFAKNEKSVLPQSFIEALRQALENELSAEEITSAVLLMVGIKEVGRIDCDSLVGRTMETLRVMKGLQQIERMESKWKGNICQGD